MASFIDGRGREWVLRLDVATNTAIRRLLGLDFCNLQQAGMSLAKIEGDNQILFDTVWLIVKPLADARSVPIEEFGAGMDGDLLAGAHAALREAVINFLSPPDREAAKATLAILTGARAELLKALSEQPLTLGV